MAGAWVEAAMVVAAMVEASGKDEGQTIHLFDEDWEIGDMNLMIPFTNISLQRSLRIKE